MKMTGAEMAVEILLEHNVDTIFGYPGGAALFIYDALYKYKDKIRHVLTAHEQGASHAADGYARSTGKTGVVLATSGPGATNLVTGIATAYMDSIPMVIITANVANATLNILYAPLWSPIATFSDTSFDIAFGTPIDDIVSNNAYI